MKHLIFLILFITIAAAVQAQTIKFVCDADATLYINGEKKGNMKKDIPLRISLPKSEYSIKAVSTDNEADYVAYDLKIAETGIEKLVHMALQAKITQRLKTEATAAEVINTKSETNITKTQKQQPPGISWITSLDELQEKMAKNPKKVFIDIYTDWCVWCKKMDADVFTNKNLIKYINANFYAVKLDAERKNNFHFNGKDYQYYPELKTNTLVVELMLDNKSSGELSYPASIFMLENFQSPTHISGYLDVPKMESILNYFGNNAYKHQSWADFSKDFKPTW